MAVKLGSARIDENGNAKGGKAGDQTGKEVSTQNWYLHKKGWRVLRCKDPNKAELIANDMQYACDNKHIGYDQGQRLTLYNEAKQYNFNCSKVTKNCETDCSALVRVCCAYAGIMVSNFRTTNEASILLKSGYFEEMKGNKYQESPDYLRRGDILVTKTQGHTVVVLSNGKYAKNPVDCNHVIVTGGSVNVREEPKQTCKIIGIAHEGDIYEYLHELIDGKWYKIKYKNTVGYISNKYSNLSP